MSKIDKSPKMRVNREAIERDYYFREDNTVNLPIAEFKWLLEMAAQGLTHSSKLHLYKEINLSVALAANAHTRGKITDEEYCEQIEWAANMVDVHKEMSANYFKLIESPQD